MRVRRYKLARKGDTGSWEQVSTSRAGEAVGWLTDTGEFLAYPVLGMLAGWEMRVRALLLKNMGILISFIFPNPSLCMPWCSQLAS